VAAFALVWIHSVEKTEWREDWRITPRGLVIAEASVQGSGAGMDPPEGARLSQGRWRWTPSLQPLASIVLRRSGATRDWSLCMEGSCAPLSRWVGPDADPIELEACKVPDR
jgi:hypothetical protein